MSNNQEIIFLTLEFQDDGLKADGEIMVRLRARVNKSTVKHSVVVTRLSSGIPMMIRVNLMLLDLFRIFLTNAPLGHLLAYTGIERAHLRTLTNFVPKTSKVFCSLDSPLAS
jgi:hypothetical protein